ncbi:hypothetical protein PWP93_20355 [Paraburkholderia sp. A1RI-2L]
MKVIARVAEAKLSAYVESCRDDKEDAYGVRVNCAAPPSCA